MSTYTYKIRINKRDLSDMQAELCVVLCDGVNSCASFEEPSRFYAKTTQAIRIDEIPSHVEKLIQLIQQAGLTPMPYYYVLLIAKDKSGSDRHIRQIRIPIEIV
jgi:hypothetical protein